MKRMLIILFIIMMALSGCSIPGAQKENAEQNVSSADKSDSIFNYAKPLTLAQVTTAIMLEGLSFSENRGEKPEDYAINSVTPAIYMVKQNDNILMIYIYDSIALRNEACASGTPGYFVSSKLPQKGNWFTVAYTAKNALIIDMVNTENYQSDTIALEQFLKCLRAAADSLNDAKELVFADKGSYWDASLTVKYYQYWYKDNTGTNHIDQQSNEKWLVKYLGSDPESIRDLKYKYTRQGGGGGSVNDNGPGILRKIGKDYYLRLGNSGSGSIPGKDDVYTLTIQWQGKKENLHLKMINQ